MNTKRMEKEIEEVEELYDMHITRAGLARKQLRKQTEYGVKLIMNYGDHGMVARTAQEMSNELAGAELCKERIKELKLEQELTK